MRIVYYFKIEMTSRDLGGRSALRYTHIQSILKGYIATCSQRISSLVTEFMFDKLSSELKEILIFPIDGCNNFKQEGRKRFIACETLYALYFHNLPILEVKKLDSYLMAIEGYLGCCEIHPVAGRSFMFNAKRPFLEMKNKSIFILADSLLQIECSRDGFLEEIIKHVAFNSWSYKELIPSPSVIFQRSTLRKRGGFHKGFTPDSPQL